MHQVDVITRRTHRHLKRATIQPDLQRLLDRQSVHPVRSIIGAEADHPLALRDSAHGNILSNTSQPEESRIVTDLSTWLDRAAAELGITDARLDNNDIHTLLDLARDCAHEVERTAAPLTTYLLGVAVGRGIETLGGAAARVTELVLADDPTDASSSEGSA